MRRITDEFDPVTQGFCGLKDWDGQSYDCTRCANNFHGQSRWKRVVGRTVHRLGEAQAAVGMGV